MIRKINGTASNVNVGQEQIMLHTRNIVWVWRVRKNIKTWDASNRKNAKTVYKENITAASNNTFNWVANGDMHIARKGLNWTTRQQDSLSILPTSLVRLKWNTKWRLGGTLPRRLSVMSLQHLIGMSWRCLKMTWRPISQSVSTTSQTSLKWTTQRRLTGKLPRHLTGRYPRRLISTSLGHLLEVPNETPNNLAVVRLHHVSELRCCKASLVGLYYIFKVLCHGFSLVRFYVSFKYHMKHQNFLGPTRRKTRREVSIIN